MEEYIIKLASIDFVSLLSALSIIIVATVVIKEAIEKFCKVVGIEFAWIRRQKERAEYEEKVKTDLDTLSKRQTELENLHNEAMEARTNFNRTVLESIDSLKNDISSLADHIDKREAEKRFKKLRFDILNFADKISKSESITAELIEQVFDEISDYENLVESYNFKNNRVNTSIAVIQAKYQELLMQGKIVKGDD